MAEPRIETLDASVLPEWDSFVGATPGGSLFLMANWHERWNLRPEVRVVRARDGRIEAGVALVRSRRLGLEWVGRPPLTPYNHPLLAPGAEPGILRRLFETLPKAAFLDFIFHPSAPPPEASDDEAGFLSLSRLTHTLVPGHEPRFGSGHRRALRRGLDHVDSGRWQLVLQEDPELAWPLFLETESSRGFHSGLDRRGFLSLARWLRERSSGSLPSIRDADGRPLACLLLARDSAWTYYLAGGRRAGLPSRFEGSFVLFDHVIRESLAAGRSFDFEGSVLPGVARFFRGFGSEPRPVARWIRAAPSGLTSLWRALLRRRADR